MFIYMFMYMHYLYIFIHIILNYNINMSFTSFPCVFNVFLCRTYIGLGNHYYDCFFSYNNVYDMLIQSGFPLLKNNTLIIYVNAWLIPK